MAVRAVLLLLCLVQLGVASDPEQGATPKDPEQLLEAARSSEGAAVVEVKELKKVLGSMTSPKQKAKFELKLQSAQQKLKLSQKKLATAQVTEPMPKPAQALLSLPQAENLAALAKTQAEQATKQAAATAEAASKGFSSKLSALTNAADASRLVSELSAKLKGTQNKLTAAVDAPAAAALKATVLSLTQGLELANAKVRVFRAEAAAKTQQTKTAKADKEAQKHQEAQSSALAAQAKLAQATKTQQAEEKKLEKSKAALEKERSAAAASEKLSADKDLDSVLKKEVSAEQSALGKAEAVGDVSKETSMLAKIQHTKQVKAQQHAQASADSKDLSVASKALDQAKQDYAKEKKRAELQIADESPQVGGVSKVDREIKELERTADQLVDTKLSIESSGFGDLEVAKTAIERGKDSVTSIAKREVVGMAREGQAKAKRVLEALRLQVSESSQASSLSSLTKLASESAQKDLGDARANFERSSAKLARLHLQAKKAKDNKASALAIKRAEQRAGDQAGKVRKLNQKMLVLHQKALYMHSGHQQAASERGFKSTDRASLAKSSKSLENAYTAVHRAAFSTQTLLAALRAGDLKASRAYLVPQETKTLKTPRTSHAAAVKALKAQIGELGEIIGSPARAAQAIAQSALKQATQAMSQPRPSRIPSRISSQSTQPSEVSISAPSPTQSVQLTPEQHLKSIQMKSMKSMQMKASKQRISKLESKEMSTQSALDIAQEALVDMKQKLVTTASQAATARGSTVGAFKTRLSKQKQLVALASTAVTQSKKLVEERRQLVSRLTSELKGAHAEGQAIKAQASRRKLKEVENRQAEAVLGKKAAGTLQDLESAEKDIASGIRQQKQAKSGVADASKRIAAAQALKAELASELTELKEAAGDRAGLSLKTNAAAVQLQKATYSSPRAALSAAQRDLSAGLLKQQQAEDQFRDAQDAVSTTQDQIQKAQSDSLAMSISAAANSKQTVLKAISDQSASSAATSASDAEASMKEKQIGSAVALALKLEQQKARAYDAKAKGTAKRAAELSTRAGALSQKLSEMETEHKAKVAGEKKKAKAAEAKVLRQQKALIKRAKSKAKEATQLVTDKNSPAKLSLVKSEEELDLLSTKLASSQAKLKSAQATSVKSLLTKAQAAKSWHAAMIKYARHNLGPATPEAIAKHEAQLQATSPAHAAQFEHHDKRSLALQVVAAKKQIADLAAQKQAALVIQAESAVNNLESQLTKLRLSQARAKIEQAQAQKRNMASALKLQHKQIQVEKDAYAAIATAEEKREQHANKIYKNVKMSKLEREADAAGVLALKVQRDSKADAAAAHQALQGLQNTLKQAIKHGNDVAQSPSPGSLKGLTQVREDAKQSTKLVTDAVGRVDNTAQKRINAGLKTVDKISGEVDSEVAAIGNEE